MCRSIAYQITKRLVSRGPSVISSSPTASRCFSTSTIHRAAVPPSLSNVDASSSSTASFDAKQKEFRDKLKAKQKADSQSSSNVDVTAASNDVAASSQTISNVGKPNDAAASTSQPKQDRGVKGALNNIIYGTKEGREMEQDMEQSFSQVLARGKYVHSIVFHEVKPNKVNEYVELVENWYPKVANAPDNHVHLVGSWRTEVGDCDTFVHIWEYEGYKGYHKSLNTIQHSPGFEEFDRKLKSLINSKKTSLMQEFSFWPTTSPRNLGGVFELRSYTLHPGHLLEWEQHWRTGLKARREVMEGVGAWFVQVGELNVVHHLWQFADLEERRRRREKSWQREGWADTVHKTVPLIKEMKSRILVPCAWSPVA